MPDLTFSIKAIAESASAISEAKAQISGLGEEAETAGGKTGGLVSNLGTLVTAAGAVGAAFEAKQFLGDSIDAVTSLAGSVQKLSNITGETPENASRLKFAFGEMGVSSDEADRVITKFSKSLQGLVENEDGTTTKSSAVIDKLKSLGLQTEDATGKALPMSDVMGQLAEQFKNMPDGTEKTALAIQLFGKSGADLIPFLDKGKEGLADLEKESDKMGLTLSGSTLQSVKDMTMAHRQMDAAMEGVKVQIGVALIPVMTALATGATNLAVGFNQVVIPAIKLASEWIELHLSPVLKAFNDWLSTIFKPQATQIFTDIFTVVQNVVAWISDHWAGIQDLLAGPIQIAKAIVIGALNEVKDTFVTVFAFIGDLLQIFSDLFQGHWGKLWGDVKALVSDAFTNIKRLISDQLDAIVGILGGVWTTIQSAAGQAWGEIQDTVTGAIHGLWQWIKDHWTDVALDIFLGPVWAFRDQILGVIQDALSNVVTGLGQIKDTIVGWATDAGTWLLDAGKALIDGLLGGITSKFDDVKNKLGDLKNKIVGWKGPIEDDQQLLVPAGVALIQGLQTGMESEYPSVMASLQTFTQHIQGLVGGAFSLVANLASGSVASGAGGVQSPAQMAAGLQAAGFPGDIATMVSILMAESGGSPNAGSAAGALGIGQFMPGSAAMVGFMNRQSTGPDLYKAISDLYRLQGFGAWDAYSYTGGGNPNVNYGEQFVGPGQGNARNFLGQAQAAVAGLSAPAQQGLATLASISTSAPLPVQVITTPASAQAAIAHGGGAGLGGGTGSGGIGLGSLGWMASLRYAPRQGLPDEGVGDGANPALYPQTNAQRAAAFNAAHPALAAPASRSGQGTPTPGTKAPYGPADNVVQYGPGPDGEGDWWWLYSVDGMRRAGSATPQSGWTALNATRPTVAAGGVALAPGSTSDPSLAKIATGTDQIVKLLTAIAQALVGGTSGAASGGPAVDETIRQINRRLVQMGGTPLYIGGS